MSVVSDQNYYELLGVSRDAKVDEIRKAYLKLAHQYHPDKTGGDKKAEDKLKRINEAYDTLKNPEKRKQYDEMLSGGAFNPFGGGVDGGHGTVYDFDFGGFGDGDGESPFADLLGSLFGGRTGGGGRRPRAGSDMEVALTVTLEDIAGGAVKGFHISRREVCGECRGSGCAHGAAPEPCPVCKGEGRVSRSGGAFSLLQTCPRCRGMGTYIVRPCGRCGGDGFELVERELSVRVPAGIDANARLRLAGEGEPGVNGGSRGDLYVRIVVAPHAFFVREGDNLVCPVPVPFTVAAVGGRIKVPTLRGVAELNVPAGTQNGTLLRMRGLGIGRLHGGRGDQLVQIMVETPAQLSVRQREVMQELRPEDSFTYPQYARFVERLRHGG